MYLRSAFRCRAFSNAKQPEHTLRILFEDVHVYPGRKSFNGCTLVDGANAEDEFIYCPYVYSMRDVSNLI
jgi:hypothetical protein